MRTIPTALTRAETDVLASLATGRRVYEAGALLGHSTITLARTARSLVSVDPHVGYPVHAPRSTWDQYLENLRTHGVLDRVKPIRSTFQLHAPALDTDVAWADLTGAADLARAFLETTTKAAIVAMHDYARGSCSGATAVIDEWIRRERPRRVTCVDTLLVMER